MIHFNHKNLPNGPMRLTFGKNIYVELRCQSHLLKKTDRQNEKQRRNKRLFFSKKLRIADR